MERVIISTEKRGGLIYEMSIPRLALAPLEEEGGPVQMITVNPVVVVRKDPEASCDT
jgi:hypothetical protein